MAFLDASVGESGRISLSVIAAPTRAGLAACAVIYIEWRHAERATPQASGAHNSRVLAGFGASGMLRLSGMQ